MAVMLLEGDVRGCGSHPIKGVALKVVAMVLPTGVRDTFSDPSDPSAPL